MIRNERRLISRSCTTYLWSEQGLTTVPIARYSPELNLIEILWRKIKYEWMPFLAYESFHALQESLFEILANIGKTYSIEFA